MEPLAILAALPSIDGTPFAAHVVERLPLPTSIVRAIRDEEGTITDFCIEYSNAAASDGSTDRGELLDRPLFEALPAFAEAGLLDHFREAVESGQPYSQDDVRLTGTYGGIAFDVVLEVVAIPLGDDRLVSVSHDRTTQHSAVSRLSSAQAALGRRSRMEEQIRAVNDGLVEDLVDIQRALDDGDLSLARRRAAEGAQRASQVVAGLRDAMRADR